MTEHGESTNLVDRSFQGMPEEVGRRFYIAFKTYQLAYRQASDLQDTNVMHYCNRQRQILGLELIQRGIADPIGYKFVKPSFMTRPDSSPDDGLLRLRFPSGMATGYRDIIIPGDQEIKDTIEKWNEAHSKQS